MDLPEGVQKKEKKISNYATGTKHFQRGLRQPKKTKNFLLLQFAWQLSKIYVDKDNIKVRVTFSKEASLSAVFVLNLFPK